MDYTLQIPYCKALLRIVTHYTKHIVTHCTKRIYVNKNTQNSTIPLILNRESELFPANLATVYPTNNLPNISANLSIKC